MSLCTFVISLAMLEWQFSSVKIEPYPFHILAKLLHIHAKGFFLKEL